jgi:hypothetical protein
MSEGSLAIATRKHSSQQLVRSRKDPQWNNARWKRCQIEFTITFNGEAVVVTVIRDEDNDLPTGSRERAVVNEIYAAIIMAVKLELFRIGRNDRRNPRCEPAIYGR